MLKRKKLANVVIIEEKDCDDIMRFLEILDDADLTMYAKEFYYVYVCEKLYSLEEIAEILILSLNALHYHLKKVNQYINSIQKFKEKVQ